jgi:predicted transcriptional regulator
MRIVAPILDAIDLRKWGSRIMATAKEEVRRMLDELPDDASYEDIQYRIYVREKIERSLAEVDRGEGVSHEEAKKRLARWLDA